jgi:hypothetical protein
VISAGLIRVGLIKVAKARARLAARHESRAE